MKRGFTYLEVILVIVIIGILATMAKISIFTPNLTLLRDQFITHFLLTASTAAKDEKGTRLFPTEKENQQAQMGVKYYFKKFWQLKLIKDDKGNISYCIFSDQPESFDKRAHNQYQTEVLTDGTGKYLCHDASNPNLKRHENVYTNLTDHYQIAKVLFTYKGKTIQLSQSKPIRFLFDNQGNLFLEEGKEGDGGDINPYDPTNRPLMTTPGRLTFCQGNGCDENLTFLIYPSGHITYIAQK